MKRSLLITIIIICFCIFNSCQEKKDQDQAAKHYQSCKPWTRWWWFASEINKEDVVKNLKWLKEQGFGGVEIAWIYPLNRMVKDTINYTPRQKWLSSEWSEIVAYTSSVADSIGMGCDFTFGTLWPFGDSKVPFHEAAMRFGDSLWRQEITASWEYPVKGYVIDHLNITAFRHYSDRLLNALPKPKIPYKNACFIDSWEVETKGLWTPGFDLLFLKEFGYDIKPYMKNLYLPENASYYYDYMKLLSKLVIAFYKEFDSVLNKNGYLSRGQCSGAPCDIMTAYSMLDIPETEALLFETYFSRIVASVATLSNKKIISSETFTCLYGWPRDFIREENIADLKLLADGLFANGVNQIIWHGKAFTYHDTDTTPFYASVHVGKSGALSPFLKSFNSYLTKVSSVMRLGRTFSNFAIYLPVEDSWMKAEMPKEKQFKWAWGEYELRYTKIPEKLSAYNPIWINGHFLNQCFVKYGLMYCNDHIFKGLYIDCQYMDYNYLKKITEFAKKGLNIYFKAWPKEPGHISHIEYNLLIHEIKHLRNVFSEENDFLSKMPVIVSGKQIPEYWCRQTSNEMYIFFANPKSKNISFPMGYGQSFCKKTLNVPVEILYDKKKLAYHLIFKPYQSILLKISRNGIIKQIDINYNVPDPKVIQRVLTGKEKWFVQ